MQPPWVSVPSFDRSSLRKVTSWVRSGLPGVVRERNEAGQARVSPLWHRSRGKTVEILIQGEVMAMYEGYCVKCREKREFDGTEVNLANGRRAAQGTCPVCGTKMNRMLGKA